MAHTLPDLQGILPRVKTALADHLLREENQSFQDFEDVEFIPRPYSCVTILRARTSAGTRRLVMKTMVHHPVNRAIVERENQAVVEYNILKRLHPQFKPGEGYSVPRPVLVVPEVETYLMDFVEGHLLADEHRYCRCFSPRRGFERLARNYRYSGRWLKRFQESTGMRAASPAVAMKGVLERCEHRLRLLAGSGDPRCPKGLGERVMGDMRAEMSLLGDRPVTVSGRHSDFGPWNILSGPGGITVIDFFGFEDDPLPVDLFKVLVYLEDEKRSLTTNKRRLRVLQESFLEGYGSLPATPPPVLRMCEAMQRVVSLWGCIQSPGERPLAKLKARRKFQANLRWLTGGRKREESYLSSLLEGSR